MQLVDLTYYAGTEDGEDINTVLSFAKEHFEAAARLRQKYADK